MESSPNQCGLDSIGHPRLSVSLSYQILLCSLDEKEKVIIVLLHRGTKYLPSLWVDQNKLGSLYTSGNTCRLLIVRSRCLFGRLVLQPEGGK